MYRTLDASMFLAMMTVTCVIFVLSLGCFPAFPSRYPFFQLIEYPYLLSYRLAHTSAIWGMQWAGIRFFRNYKCKNGIQETIEEPVTRKPQLLPDSTKQWLPHWQTKSFSVLHEQLSQWNLGSEQQRLRSVCAYAQTDLRLRCSPLPPYVWRWLPALVIYTQRQWKVTSKSHTLNIGQYLVHSVWKTVDTSTLNFVA